MQGLSSACLAVAAARQAPTLLDLVAAVAEVTPDSREVVAVVSHLLSTRVKRARASTRRTERARLRSWSAPPR
jgi:hypothetical protein